jgi:hypothetical protein
MMDHDSQTARESRPGASPKTVADRKQLLARTVAIHIARGARVDSQTDTRAVIAWGLRLHNNHGLTLTGGETRAVITVDDYGNVTLEHL